MHIKEIFKLYKTTISFEFFPPKSVKASETLYQAINDLIPIIAGLMPVTSFKNIKSMADLAARVRFPARLLKALRRCETDAQVEQAGIHWAAEQVRDLLDHEVRGIHFYTLNKSAQIKKICDSLGLTHTPQFNR